jgi:peptidoglycan DL-endopeptidase CwlO
LRHGEIQKWVRNLDDGPVSRRSSGTTGTGVTVGNAPGSPVAARFDGAHEGTSSVLKSLPAVATRATVVIASAAAAAVFATLPGQPATPPAPVQPAAPVAAQIVPVASTTYTMSLATVAAPAAQRASAVKSALGKVGSPYRYGAAGPNAFDCSGLVHWAFRSAGKSLPRSSSAMSRIGKPVAKSDLQPGDLVFFYKPVSHVAIYVGNGKVVHASNKKSPVKVADMGRMPFNSARRV